MWLGTQVPPGSGPGGRWGETAEPWGRGPGAGGTAPTAGHRDTEVSPPTATLLSPRHLVQLATLACPVAEPGLWVRHRVLGGFGCTPSCCPSPGNSEGKGLRGRNQDPAPAPTGLGRAAASRERDPHSEGPDGSPGPTWSRGTGHAGPLDSRQLGRLVSVLQSGLSGRSETRADPVSPSAGAQLEGGGGQEPRARPRLAPRAGRTGAPLRSTSRLGVLGLR